MMFDNDSLEAFLEIAGTITQAELPIVHSQGRMGEYAVAYRIYRNKQGGGFGDPDKHPFSWAVLVYVDGLPLRVNSARGECRAWSNLDRIGQWMMDNGFKLWWTRNDLEAVKVAEIAEIAQPQDATVVVPETEATPVTAGNPELATEASTDAVTSEEQETGAP